jgi:hypothetical protein
MPSDRRHHTSTLILRVIYAVPEATTLLLVTIPEVIGTMPKRHRHASVVSLRPAGVCRGIRHSVLRLFVCVRDVHYKCDITLRFDLFRLVRRVSVLIARFCVVLRVRRDSPGRGERRLVLLGRTQVFAKLRSSSEVRNVQSS